MILKPESTIEKGKRLEKFVAKEIQSEGLGKAQRTSGSGSGEHKGDIFANLPFLLECKNQPSVRIQAILNWIDQAKRQAERGNWDRNKWGLIVRDPRVREFDEVYAVIDFWEFLGLLKRYSEPLVKKPDREMRWKLEGLMKAIKAVLKLLPK